MRLTRPRILRVLLLGSLGLGIAWGLAAPMTTHQGVNFQVSTLDIPSYVKAIDFLHRHYQYQLIADRITHGLKSDQERVLAVFDWTRRNIRRTPKDWPIMDDHILHIIIRGHGMSDQLADVFTTLSTYAGIPAFWMFVRGLPEGSPGLVLSFAKVDGAWRVFDVARGVVFSDSRGQLIDVETLLAAPALADSAARPTPPGLEYAPYVEHLRPFSVPDPLRAEQQMPWPRLFFEIRHALRLKPVEAS